MILKQNLFFDFISFRLFLVPAADLPRAILKCVFLMATIYSLNVFIQMSAQSNPRARELLCMCVSFSIFSGKENGRNCTLSFFGVITFNSSSTSLITVKEDFVIQSSKSNRRKASNCVFLSPKRCKICQIARYNKLDSNNNTAHPTASLQNNKTAKEALTTS